jgi:hypothetical protein
MPAIEPIPLTKNDGGVREFYTEARVEALNTALADKGIAAEKIICILHIPGQIVVSPTPAQFRVIYREN